MQHLSNCHSLSIRPDWKTTGWPSGQFCSVCAPWISSTTLGRAPCRSSPMALQWWGVLRTERAEKFRAGVDDCVEWSGKPNHRLLNEEGEGSGD